MKHCVLAACLVLASLACGGAALARPLTADEVNAASLNASRKPSETLYFKAQVLLDRAGLSPGAIDGRDGDNFKNALRAFQKKNALNETGALDQDTWGKLAEDSEPVLIEYTIRDTDVEGPFARKIPVKFEAKAKLKHLYYTSAAEKLAERFHMDQQFFRQLNRGRKLDRADSVILVANVNLKPVALGAKAARVEVDKENNILRVFAKDGSLLAAYPATIGSEEKPAPSGTLKVVRVVHNPTYVYNPAFKFREVKTARKFKIAPGPNNPVGVVWIALDQKGYGIHGTAEPSRIGKTFSHGCVRLTNWDALALANMVRKGTEVAFLD